MKRTPCVVALAVPALAFTLGCSSASSATGGGGGGGGGSGADDGWATRTNIEAIFESYCSSCHGATWSTCWNVQANASLVDTMISSGAMPRVGMLTPSDKTTLLTWLGDGAPCEGTPPADAGSIVITGPPIGDSAPSASR